MEENNLPLLVPNRMHCKGYNPLRAISQVIGQFLNVGLTPQRLQAGLLDFGLHFLVKTPPSSLPEKPSQDFLRPVATRLQAHTIGIHHLTVQSQYSGED